MKIRGYSVATQPRLHHRGHSQESSCRLRHFASVLRAPRGGHWGTAYMGCDARDARSDGYLRNLKMSCRMSAFPFHWFKDLFTIFNHWYSIDLKVFSDFKASFSPLFVAFRRYADMPHFVNTAHQRVPWATPSPHLFQVSSSPRSETSVPTCAWNLVRRHGPGRAFCAPLALQGGAPLRNRN